MQKFTLTCMLFLSIISLPAQTWAPVGAKWTYSLQNLGFPYENSPVYLECTGDTTILGKSCRILYAGWLSCSYYWNKEAYIYYDDEKIYMYVDSVVGFHILYDFSAGPGDSWTIIAPGHQVGDTSTIIVDSVGIRLFPSGPYEVQYIHPLDPYSRWAFNEFNIMNYGNYYCFFPLWQACDPICGPIRCYEDSTVLIHFQDIACDSIVYVGIDDSPTAGNILIYPNPCKDELNVDFTGNSQKYLLEILSTTGQLEYKTNKTVGKMTIPTKHLNQGVYFIRVTDLKGNCIVKKFLKY